MTKIGLLGCGSWGTTLAQILAKKGETVNAWHYRKDFVDAISESRVNPLLPDIILDEKISFHYNINNVLDGSNTLLIRSITASSHNDISSINNISPFFIHDTNGPSCHSNNATYDFRN